MDSNRSIRPRISGILCVAGAVSVCLVGGTRKWQLMPRAVQFEHGWTRLHFSFLDRHDWHETGSGRVLPLRILGQGDEVGKRSRMLVHGAPRKIIRGDPSLANPSDPFPLDDVV